MPHSAHDLPEGARYKCSEEAVITGQPECNQDGMQQPELLQRKIKTYRYTLFFVKDWVESGEIDIKHCPTDAMVADFLTKPLQGEAFQKFHDTLMGSCDMSETNPYETGQNSVIQD